MEDTHSGAQFITLKNPQYVTGHLLIFLTVDKYVSFHISQPGSWGSVTVGITEVIQIRHRETRSALERTEPYSSVDHGGSSS